MYAAAIAAFAREGYEGTSVRTIADDAGVTVSVIYHHYGNKQDLLYSILTASTKDLARDLDEAVDDGPARPDLLLARLVMTMARYYANRTPEASVLNMEMRHLSPENLAKHLPLRRRIQAMFDKAIAEGCAAGYFQVENQKVASRVIIVMCRDIASWFRSDGKWTDQEVALDYVRMALDVVRTKPASRRRALAQFTDVVAQPSSSSTRMA